MSSEENNSFEHLKYLLGNIGIEILVSINKGAKTPKIIKLFSGVSYNCILGRLPVLIDLDLITKEDDDYILTLKGIQFLSFLKKEWNQFNREH